MESVTPEDLTVDEMRTIAAAVEAAADRVGADPAARIRRAVDVIESRGWTHQHLSQVALALEAIIRDPQQTSFRPYIVR